MKVYFAADHAGFALKNELLNLVRGEMSLDVEDCGAYMHDASDNYPEIIARAAKLLSADANKGIDSRAILIGASGQGEAMVANRFACVRAAVYYGEKGSQTDTDGRELDMIASTRAHNDANALSLGARFLSVDEARVAVRSWLTLPFSGEARHVSRIGQIEQVSHE